MNKGALNYCGMRYIFLHMKHLKIILILLATFVVNFTYQNGWKDAQGPGDDPVYVQSAYDYWNKGAYPGSITWSPGYVAMMSPIVGKLGIETGYKVWRFLVFFGVSVLVYLVFMRMFGSVWIGAVMALYSQMLLLPYMSPSLQTLLCLLYLLCLLLLAEKNRYLGFVFAILINCIFISGSASTVLMAFALLCICCFPRSVFSMRFAAQLLVGVALFAATLHHFKYDIRIYFEEATKRGRAGLYHQLSLYIVSSGRSTLYLRPGEDDPNLHNVDEYHRHLKAIDRYYQDKFGGIEDELRQKSQDPRWPAFLLDWPWLIKKDPDLMKEYGVEVLRTFSGSMLTAFEAVTPYDNKPSIKRAIINVGVMFFVAFAALLPYLRKFSAGGHAEPENLRMPTRQQMLFALSCVATVVPLILVKPLDIYFPPLIPVYLLVVATLGVGLFRKFGPWLQARFLASAPKRA